MTNHTPTLSHSTAPISQQLADCFGEHRVESGARAALIGPDGESTTYAELSAALNTIAHQIAAASTADPAGAVVIISERSTGLVRVMLAAMRAGRPVLLVNPAESQARVQALLDNVRPGVVLTSTAATPRFDELTGYPLTALSDIDSPGTNAGEEWTCTTSIANEDVAYYVSTSGTTAQAKCIAVPWATLDNLIEWQRSRRSGQSARTLSLSSIGFDVFFQEVLATLAVGSTLYLADDAATKDPRVLLDVINATAIDRIFLPYTRLNLLASTAMHSNISCPSMQVVISSGEALILTDPIRSWLDQSEVSVLENQYGPAETHVVTAYEVLDLASAASPVPIGTAIDGIAVSLNNIESTPNGDVGEIWVSGPSVALGYLIDGEVRPFESPRAGAPKRIYRTGDYAFADEAGDLVFLERRDDTIKVRGYRVTLTAVEDAIIRTAGIEDAVVAPVTTTISGAPVTELVAAIVTSSYRESSVIIDMLAEHLPPHMIPSPLVTVEHAPLTQNGKRDRRRVIELVNQARDERLVHTGLATMTSSPEELAVFSALALAAPGKPFLPDDNFFEAGMSSVEAMQLVAHLSAAGAPITLADVIEMPSARELAELVEEGRDRVLPPNLVDLTNGLGFEDSPVLHLIHPLGGSVLPYFGLARRLSGHGVPVIGIQARALSTNAEHATALTEIADHYLQQVVEAGHQQPYVFSGWSFGGVIAVEMARRAQAAGHDVAGIVLVDSAYGRAFAEDIAIPEDYLADTRSWFNREVASVLGIESASESDAHCTPEYEMAYAVYLEMVGAAIGHRIASVDVPVVLVRADEPLPESLTTLHTSFGSNYGDPTHGWAQVCHQGLTIVDTPGDHLTLISSEFEEQLAEAIATAVNSLKKV